MTTTGLATGTRTMNTAVRPRRNLEELVNRLMAALFSEATEKTTPMAMPSLAGSFHEARRMRKVGETDDALAVLTGRRPLACHAVHHGGTCTLRSLLEGPTPD